MWFGADPGIQAAFREEKLDSETMPKEYRIKCLSR